MTDHSCADAGWAPPRTAPPPRDARGRFVKRPHVFTYEEDPELVNWATAQFHTIESLLAENADLRARRARPSLFRRACASPLVVQLGLLAAALVWLAEAVRRL